MDDLIGLLIFLFFIFASRIGELLERGAKKGKSPPPEPPRRRAVPKRPTLAEWLEELERRMYPLERPEPLSIPEPAGEPVPLAPSEPTVQVRPAPETAFPLHTPQPERIGLTGTTLREPSQTAERILGPTDLRRAVVMSEILGPPRCKRPWRPGRR